MNFDGIFTPIVTPYKEDFKIDFNNLEKTLNHLIDSKVHGIIVGGTTGEYYAQSLSERIEILKFAKKITKNKIPLVAGVGSLRTEDCVFLAKASRDLQYNAILITSPPYSQPTQKENANHALTIDRSVDMPILLYNFPGKMGSEMGKEYLEIVSKSDKSCSEIFDELPVNLSTPEININFEKHGQQFDAMDALSSNIDFPNANIDMIDGFRVDYENCWGLVRPSNTTPCLVLRFEAEDVTSLKEIQEKFKKWLQISGISTENI